MKKWLQSLKWSVDVELFNTRASEALREIAILWLVFANLDKLLENELTAIWGVVNSICALCAWVLGLYIEVHRQWRNR